MEAPIGLKGPGGRSSSADWQDYSEIAARTGDGDLGRRLAAVIAAIGQERFEARLADLLAAAANLDQINVVSLEGERTRPLFSWHRACPEMASDLVGQYVSERFFQRDPTLDRLTRSKRQGLCLGLMRRGQIEDDWYRRHFFDDAQLEGKLSILDQSQTHAIYQNYYFATGTEAFSLREVENLARLAETASQCILRHLELRATPAEPSRPDPATVSRILNRRAPSLAVREREVCSRIVTGYTTEAIALDLGITANSVATYRKRAYAKLGICSQHQLFLLCLDT
ncbi:helix-turn-helix transcriptional regulator [Magnetospirillum sp. 15-1]|uniref:helix-turn-helix transcriptional regulator n=1 Tax=Magnetospirillum sp. 15-1 TaxID=1979370 RepID=UPI001482A106|nr:helix-turn-helix transcriptional regulator [Magnetospirillum sp. 15-1]